MEALPSSRHSWPGSAQSGNHRAAAAAAAVVAWPAGRDVGTLTVAVVVAAEAP